MLCTVRKASIAIRSGYHLLKLHWMLLLPISSETIFPDSAVSKAVVLKYSIKDVLSYTYFPKMEQINIRISGGFKSC